MHAAGNRFDLCHANEAAAAAAAADLSADSLTFFIITM